jgi:hypothetical protein
LCITVSHQSYLSLLRFTLALVLWN